MICSFESLLHERQDPRYGMTFSSGCDMGDAIITRKTGKKLDKFIAVEMNEVHSRVLISG